MDQSKELATIYKLGRGLDAGSPLNNQEFIDLVKDIESGDKGMKAKCPHCKSIATIRSSKDVGSLVREAKCQCSNLACGHTFVAMLEVVRTISPSAFPDPLVAAQLKQSPRWRGVHDPVENAGVEHFSGSENMP